MSDETTQDRGELHDLLGSGGDAAKGVEMHDGTVTTIEKSTTVLTTDRWTKRAGARLAEQWAEMLRTDPPLDGEETDEETETNVTGDAITHMTDPNVAADAIETLLSPKPTMAEAPEDPHRAKWWSQLLNSPETTALRSRTVSSAALAEIAASEIAGAYATYVVEHPPKPEGEDGEGEGEESPEESVARMRSTRGALKAASEAADAADAIGAGLGLGANADVNSLAKYTRKLRQSPNLSAIMRMAGRFIAKAARLQRQRTDLAGMEMTGIELSGDLGRVLPIEAAQIAGVVPELETLALLRLAERRSLSVKRIMRKPKAMGPIVVSIDESGSMSGDRIAAAKGLALAMASIARAQKRPFMLVGWSDGPISTVSGDAGSDALVEWLASFQGGGTNLKGPLWTLTTEGWPEGKVGGQADHIIITDGEVECEPWLLDHYKAWSKGTNVRTFGIAIGVRKVDTLAKFCDAGVWALKSLDLDNEAVDVVLSIGPTYEEVK
jgi:uncharacterized protein with von Willebrand factor type A (vWA) domain